MPKNDDADRAISALKELTGVELDRDLAMALGIDASAVSAWRKRGAVPEKYRLQAQRLADENDAESPVRPSYFALRNGYIFALLGVAAIQLESTVARLAPAGDEVWYGFRLFKLHAELERLFPISAQSDLKNRDGLRLKYDQLRKRIAEGDLIGWIESLPSPL